MSHNLWRNSDDVILPSSVSSLSVSIRLLGNVAEGFRIVLSSKVLVSVAPPRAWSEAIIVAKRWNYDFVISLFPAEFDFLSIWRRLWSFTSRFASIYSISGYRLTRKTGFWKEKKWKEIENLSSNKRSIIQVCKGVTNYSASTPII